MVVLVVYGTVGGGGGGICTLSAAESILAGWDGASRGISGSPPSLATCWAPAATISYTII